MLFGAVFCGPGEKRRAEDIVRLRKAARKGKLKKNQAVFTIDSESGMVISLPELRPRMHRIDPTDAVANVLRKVFPAILFLCLPVSGCGYSCYSGFWNGSASGVGVSNTSCPLTKAMGAVTVQMSVASTSSGTSAVYPSLLGSPRPSLNLPSASSTSNNVEHIFVTLRGIEALAAGPADADSSSWQELVPDLEAHPAQLDLLSSSAQLPQAFQLPLTGDSQSLSSPAEANAPVAVPADEYRQLRLRLAPSNAFPDNLAPQSNACGSVGCHCIVLAGGSVRPLQFDSSDAGFRVTAERATDTTQDQGTASVFRVLPGELIHLSIEFDPASSVFFASNAAVRLVPVFKVVSRSSSPTASTQ